MSGCGVTLSPVKRKPLQIVPLDTSLAPKNQSFITRFESTLPGTPLTETVWDNFEGAFADAKESKQIGFTQNYSVLIPATVVGGAVGGAVVGTQPSYTRIVIPFGRIYQGVTESGLQKAFPNSRVCHDDAGEASLLQSTPTDKVIRLKITRFQVWEKPLNHLNMSAEVECKAFRNRSSDQLWFSDVSHCVMTNQPIGSVMTTSGGFIKEMNKVVNQFAARLAEDTLRKLHNTLEE